MGTYDRAACEAYSLALLFSFVVRPPRYRASAREQQARTTYGLASLLRRFQHITDNTGVNRE